MGIFSMRWRRRPSVLVLGSDGMLGSELFSLLVAESAKRTGIGYVYGMDGDEVRRRGITERHGLGAFLSKSRRFDVCVNCIAMTDTKAAESATNGRNLSYELNARLPGWLAESCAFRGVRMVHISTDYVFSEKSVLRKGDSPNPIWPGDPEFPTSVYGTHKLMGEHAAELAFAVAGKSDMLAILRTSWLYGQAGQKSFAHKIVRNAVKAALRGEFGIDVTSNETSVPTSVEFLSRVIADDFVKKWKFGTFNAVPSGYPMSRADWAKAILDSFSRTVNVDESDTAAKALSVDFVRPVERTGVLNPAYSALSPSEFSSDAATVPCREWIERFASKYAQAIYDKAKTE